MIPVLFLYRMSTKRRIGLKKRSASTEKPYQTGSVSNYCRTCLSTEGLVSIFCSKEPDEKRSRNLKLVTGLVIKSNDGLSQRICLKCTEAINSTLKFRRASKKAEKALLEMTNSKPRPKKKTRDKSDLHSDVSSKNIKSEIKVEIEPVAADFSFDNYGDDFQNDDYKDDIDTVVKQVRAPRKKRTPVTPATSYKCGTCHKEFRMKATFKAHMRFHTNFCVCETCGKRCRNNNQLVEHKRARHGLGRVHTCTFCEYSAATKEALTIHERRHTGERPYVCDHCAAAFHRRSNLVQHIAIHSTDTNWQCDMCPKRLKSKKFLQIHKHNAHTGKRYGYLCGVCSHRFEKPNKVRAHTRRVHDVPDDQQGPIKRVEL